jgi:hypothetical protein
VANVLGMPYNDDLKGQTSFTFDVSGFTVALFRQIGKHYFTISVEDGNEKVSSGTLTVTVEIPEMDDEDED